MTPRSFGCGISEHKQVRDELPATILLDQSGQETPRVLNELPSGLIPWVETNPVASSAFSH